MPSSIDVLARPVRIFCRSRLKLSTAFFMPSSASFVMSLIMIPSLGEAGLFGVADDLGAHRLAAHDALDVATAGHVEHDDGHLVIAAQREGGRIHHLEVLAQRLAERH